MVFSTIPHSLPSQNSGSCCGCHAHSITNEENNIFGKWSLIGGILQPLPQCDPGMFIPVFLIWKQTLNYLLVLKLNFWRWIFNVQIKQLSLYRMEIKPPRWWLRLCRLWNCFIVLMNSGETVQSIRNSIAASNLD